VLLNHRRALRLVGALLAATAVVFALVALDLTQPVDDAFLDLMVATRVDPLVWVSKVLSKIGGVWVNWPLRVAALLGLLWKRRLLQAGAFALAVASSELLIGFTKALYDRPRPLEALVETSGASFPSGHSIAGAVTAVGLVVVLLPPGRARWAWELRAAAFAVAMSFSRTYLGAHWLTDVVAGGLLGTSLAVGWPALLQEIRTRVQRRQVAALR
jgi:membrane-associated phospholipid phosphatase